MNNLFSISQLWCKKKTQYLAVRKPLWTEDFFFVVRSINSKEAIGDTYKRSVDGSYSIIRRDVSYNSNVKAFCLFKSDSCDNDNNRYSDNRSVIQESEKTSFSNNNFDNQISEQSVNKRSQEYPSNKLEASDTVKTGCEVTLLFLADNEKSTIQLISSSYHTFYKTMSYKRKNYTEEILSSKADGLNTISDSSPLGKAILNKRIGDIVEYSVNGNKKRVKILSVNNPE